MALFPSIDRVTEYIFTFNSYDPNDVWKPLPFEIVHQFLCSHMSYNTWYEKYVIANPDFFVLPGQVVRHHYTNYIYINETPTSYFLTFVVNEFLTHGLQQLAVSFPYSIKFTMTSGVMLEADITTSNLNSLLIKIKQKLTTIHSPEEWVVQNFNVRIPKETYDKFLSHEICMLCSDFFFTHPKNKYWIMTLPMNSPTVITEKEIKFKILTKTKIKTGKLQTAITVDNNRLGLVAGYPFAFYFLDKQFSTKEEYLWGDVRMPLEFIIADLQEKIKHIATTVDFSPITERIDSLESANKELADKVKKQIDTADIDERFKKHRKKSRRIN